MNALYRKVASRLNHNKNLVFVMLDPNKNEIEGQRFGGFPQIKFYTVTNKYQPLSYEGEKTEESFIKWIKLNVDHPWIE